MTVAPAFYCIQTPHVVLTSAICHLQRNAGSTANCAAMKHTQCIGICIECQSCLVWLINEFYCMVCRTEAFSRQNCSGAQAAEHKSGRNLSHFAAAMAAAFCGFHGQQVMLLVRCLRTLLQRLNSSVFTFASQQHHTQHLMCPLDFLGKLTSMLA